MVLAYVVLYLPYTVQYVTSAFTQINDSLLQAGRVFGGTPSYVFRRVTLPMISRGIFAGWMMIFIIAFRELVTASFIAPPNTLVVSTYINREFERLRDGRFVCVDYNHSASRMQPPCRETEGHVARRRFSARCLCRNRAGCIISFAFPLWHPIDAAGKGYAWHFVRLAVG